MKEYKSGAQRNSHQKDEKYMGQLPQQSSPNLLCLSI